jgi:hypothetical protein
MAVVASILTAIYHMLKGGTMYHDLSCDHFKRQSTDQQTKAPGQALVRARVCCGTQAARRLRQACGTARVVVARSYRVSFFLDFGGQDRRPLERALTPPFDGPPQFSDSKVSGLAARPAPEQPQSVGGGPC